MMSKTVGLIIVISILILIGEIAGDWDNFLLRGTGYKFVTDKNDHVFIVDSRKMVPVVEQQVVDYKFVKNQLFVLRMVAQSADCYDLEGMPTIITRYSDIKEYWILDLKSKQRLGPYPEQEFKKILKKLDRESVDLTVPSGYKNNIEEFSKWKSNCAKLEWHK